MQSKSKKKIKKKVAWLPSISPDKKSHTTIKNKNWKYKELINN